MREKMTIPCLRNSKTSERSVLRFTASLSVIEDEVLLGSSVPRQELESQ